MPFPQVGQTVEPKKGIYRTANEMRYEWKVGMIYEVSSPLLDDLRLCRIKGINDKGLTFDFQEFDDAIQLKD